MSGRDQDAASAEAAGSAEDAGSADGTAQTQDAVRKRR